MDGQTVSLIALGLTAVGFIATHFRTKGTVDVENRLMKEVGAVVNRVIKVETQMEVYLNLQEKFSAQILHRADDKDDIDKLLEDRQELKPLGGEGDRTLDKTLEEIINDPKESVSRRATAAQMLSARIARDVEC